jgi:hypothetical protein
MLPRMPGPNSTERGCMKKPSYIYKGKNKKLTQMHTEINRNNTFLVLNTGSFTISPAVSS